MTTLLPIQDLAQLVAFFAQPPSAEGFSVLFSALREAVQSRPEEVDDWIVFCSQELADWPDALRMVEWRVDWDDEQEVDRFLSQAHSLYDLPRSFYVEGDGDGSLTNYLDAFFQAPNVGCFRRLSLCWFGGGPTPKQLEDWFTPDRELLSLELNFGTLSDGHALALARCRGLHSLHELNLGGHVLSQQGMQVLSQAPILSGLRRFLIGEAPGEVHWSSREERCGELYFSQTEALTLRQRMPQLEMLLAVDRYRERHGVQWSEPPPSDSVQARLVRLLADFRAPTEPYPFDGESAAACWLEPEQVLPEQSDWHEWTNVYGLGFAEGPPRFDEQGALQSPLGLRCVARVLEPKTSSYHGQWLHQMHFAREGLVLEEHQDGLLWLYPARCDKGSDLVRLFAALRAAERAYGGRNVEYACSPWHEIMGGVVEEYGVRCILTWPEADHAFGPRGELGPDGQVLSLRGDPFPLVAALQRVGMTLVSRDDLVVLKRC